MGGRPVFERVDLVATGPDGTRERIVVCHEGDLGGAILGEWDRLEGTGGRMEIAWDRFPMPGDP